jgi:hypothetical protein
VSADPAGHPAGPGAGPLDPSGQVSEEELRAAYEAELSRITSAEMMLQAAVSLLNVGSRRLGLSATRPTGAPGGPGSTAAQPGAQRDLDQVRDAIDGVRALLEILERRLPRDLGPLRDALSQLQMAYAREVQQGADETRRAPGEARASEPDAPGGDAAASEPGHSEPSHEGSPAAADKRPDGPGPAEASGRLWVPGR